MNLSIIFADKVLQLRQQRQWSQEDLAEAANMHRNQIGRIERHEACTSIDNAGKIADALDVSLSVMLLP